MDRILRNTQPTIVLEILDDQGALLDPDPGFTNLVTVSVEDSGGTALLTDVAATRASAGRYTRVLTPAQTANLDTYTARWKATISGALQTFRTHFEIVGGFFFSLAELRASRAPFADAVAYPASDLSAAREYAEEIFERECGIAFRPRGARDQLSGDGTATLMLENMEPILVVSASTTDSDGTTTAFSAPEVADVVVSPSGLATRRSMGAWESGVGNIEVFYEHGMEFTPEPVRRQAIILAAEQLLTLNKPAREITVGADGGYTRYSVPGKDGATGLLTVDAVIQQFSRKGPVIV